MKKTIILILFTLISYLSISQTDFKNGYILLSEKDTVYGQINNKNYYINSLYCDFRKNSEDSIKRYYPRDLYGYKFSDGKYYISKTIQKDSKDTMFFFEFLVKSKLNIYFRQNQFENNYYISDDGITLNKLKYINDDIYIENRKMRRENKQFIGLLDYYTKDCPEVKKDIAHIAKPNHKNLIKLTEKYNNLTCPDGQCLIYEKKIPHNIKINLNSGFNYSFISTITDEPISYATYGFDILFQQSRQRERFYLGFGLTYDPFYIPEKNLNFYVPLSFYYLHPKKGFSPMFKYSVNIPLFILQYFGVGVRYKYEKISFFILSELQTFEIIKPIGISEKAGITIDLN